MNFLRAPHARLFFALSCAGVLAACGGGGGGAVPSAPTANSSPKPVQIISQNGQNITLTGTIVGMIAGGFSIQGGPGIGYLHVYVNNQTVITGPAPYVGEYVEVSGLDPTGSYINATSVTQLTSTPLPSATPSAGPTATPSAPPTPGPSGSPIPLPSGVVSTYGQITSTYGGKFTVQAGRGCGYVTVTAGSGTTYLDGQPAVGQYGEFAGSGSRCGTVSASSISVSSSPFTSGTYPGTVLSATPYGFTLTSGGQNVPVVLTSSTVVFGSTLAVGSNVTVTAMGTASTGLLATQIAVSAPPTPTPNPSSTPSPTPGPISQQHVAVAGLIYGYGGIPTTIPLSQVVPYVNWAFTDEQHAAALRAAGLKVMIYTNFWRNYTSDNPLIGYTDLEPGGAHASAEATDCNGVPIQDPNYGGGYEADPRTSSALAHAQVVVNYRIGEYAPNYDAIFSDDSGAVGGITQPCNYDEPAYDAAVNAVHQSLGMPMWINALGAAPNPANAIDLATPSNVMGAMCEQCYDSNGQQDAVQTGTGWQNVENAEIGMVAQQKTFWAYPRASGDAGSETAIRLYAYASFLLSYDPSYTMFEEALSTPSGFPVMPETGFLPEQPLTTAANVGGYLAAGGAYFREFAKCYYRGNFVNNCAVVVNSSAASVPVPSTSYSHSLVLSGSGVLDGGTVAFNGPAVTQLAPGTAAILLP